MSKHSCIAMFGYGTLGRGVHKLLNDNLVKQDNIEIRLKKIVTRQIVTKRPIGEGPLFTTNPDSAFEDPDIDTIVELIGGIEPARTIALRSLASGKNFVTANKMLLSMHCREIFETARKNGVKVGFEASVCGSIPVIKILAESMPNKITSIKGIVNGTTNYILTRMGEGMERDAALRIAQEKGFAEADPTTDIEGIDAAHKLSILASIAHDANITYANVYCEGLGSISAIDVSSARDFGYVIKLLAIAKATPRNLDLRVHPVFIRKDHQLASVMDEFNAVYVEGLATGPQMYWGKGAGQLPTANAVVADIIGIANGTMLLPYLSQEPELIDTANLEMRYYLRFMALDRPGVLSQISGVLGRNDISIESVKQIGREKAEAVPLVIITHKAIEKNLREAMRAIDSLPVIKEKSVLIRIDDD